jgi:membrane fusion protein (multidrug efflux system)
MKIKLLLRICGLGILLASGTACNRDGTAAPQTKAGAEAVPVEIASVRRGPIRAIYSGTATLASDHEAQVVAKTSGVLKRLHVEEGERVKAGQLLAELDDAEARSKLAQAEAQMHKSEAAFAHAQAAVPNKLIPQFEYEQDKYDLEEKRAARAGAELQLAYTRIVAPVDGVVAERSVKIGNMIQANQNLFRIVGMDPLQAVLNVPERQLGILQPGQTVQLEADALPGRRFAGTIRRIAPVVDPGSGTFRVTCEFRNPDGALKAGMFARIEIVYDHRDDALTIPRAALLEEDGETAVFVVEPGPTPVARANSVQSRPGTPAAAPTLIAHRRVIQVGYGDGDRVEVRSGLEEGARVITVGRNAVRDGTAVQVLDVKPNTDRSSGDRA